MATGQREHRICVQSRKTLFNGGHDEFLEWYLARDKSTSRRSLTPTAEEDVTRAIKLLEEFAADTECWGSGEAHDLARDLMMNQLTRERENKP